jgi:tetratricopeptide (TPR) repeat protein
MRSSFPPAWPAVIVACVLGGSGSLASADDLAEAQRLLKQGQPTAALSKVEAHVARQPDDAQGRFTQGLILTEMGRSAEAMAVFSKLIEDYPELPEPYNNLAVLYEQQKQYDKARTALEMAIRVHPGYATAYDNLGDLYARLARRAYAQAVQLDPSLRATQGKLSSLRELGSSASGSGGKRGEATRISEKPAAAPKVADLATAAGKPAPTATRAASTGDGEAVSKALQGWANAWSRKDEKAYFAYYAPDFRVPRGISRKEWQEGRAQQMRKPGKLLVEAEGIRVSFADDKATVRFRQHYTSPYLKSSVGKTIVLVKSRGRWLIQQERVG